MFWQNRPLPPRRPPAGARIYAIGDVHGCLRMLNELHAKIAADAQGAPERRRVIVYVGDYIDRGPHSKGVVETLACGRPMDGFECVYLKGNHEAFMLAFLDGDLQAGANWLHNGGAETLASYGVDPGDGFHNFTDLRRLADAFAAAVPNAHRQFLKRLRLYHVEGEYAFVHAGISPGLSLDQQHEDDLLWIREPFLGSEADHGHVVVHGHTPVKREENRANRINIDTGAVYGGRLTAVVLADAERRFLHVSA